MDTDSPTKVESNIAISQYWKQVHDRNRSIYLFDDNELLMGALSFFVMSSEEEAEHAHRTKAEWQVLDDLTDGPVIYIDHLFTQLWTYPIRRQVQRQIQTLIPSSQIALWWRPLGNRDRRVIVHRRDYADHILAES